MLFDVYIIFNEIVLLNQLILILWFFKLWECYQLLFVDNCSFVDSVIMDNRYSLVESISISLLRQFGLVKFRRCGYCEVIIIEGVGGLGKSCFVQLVLVDVCRCGYCVIVKFDMVWRIVFGLLFKLFLFFFKQVWGERNIEMFFYQMLKQYIWFVWLMLY